MPGAQLSVKFLPDLDLRRSISEFMRNMHRAQRIRDALGIHISASERLDPELEKEFYKG